MLRERKYLDTARELAQKELQNGQLDPEQVLKSVEEGLDKFLKTGDRAPLDNFLDDPQNEKAADLLTQEREEFGGQSILSIFRKARQQDVE